MFKIYLRTNTVNGKKYVGQAKDFKRREYQWHDTKQSYAGALINNARKKYGVENFKTEILDECETLEEANELEKYYIKKLNTKFPNGYNLTNGGEGIEGFEHSEETRKKIAETKKGERNPQYGKTPWNKGMTMNDELREKLSKSHVGNTSALGHVVDEETKKKISMKKKGIPNTKLEKKVIQIKPNGEIVQWKSVRQCKNNGFKTVDKVCRGERPQAYGCKWYYKDDYIKNEE